MPEVRDAFSCAITHKPYRKIIARRIFDIWRVSHECGGTYDPWENNRNAGTWLFRQRYWFHLFYETTDRLIPRPRELDDLMREHLLFPGQWWNMRKIDASATSIRERLLILSMSAIGYRNRQIRCEHLILQASYQIY